MIQLIKAATLSQNNAARSQAEQQLKKSRLENTQEFFLQLSNIFSNKQVPSNIRSSAGILINTSTPTIIQNRVLWDCLQKGTKQTIKEKVLFNMIDQDIGVRRAAANVVAAICCVQLPRGQWTNIITNLVNNMKHEQQNIRGVSIMTLGFICQKLKQKNFPFNKEMQQNIISAILIGVKDTVKDNKLFALKAFRDSLFAMTIIMQTETYRTFIVKNIAEIIQDDLSKNMGLQILAQFAKNYYPLLEAYIVGFYGILEPIIANSSENNEQNCTMAMQFWQTVADQYKERLDEGENVRKYITGEMGIKLISSLLKNLCIQDSQDAEQNHPIHQSADKTLQRICQCGASQYQKTFIEFITGTLRHNDWKFRQASVKAFSILLLGLQQNKVNNMVVSSITDFLGLLNDKSKKVQYACLQSLNLITQVGGVGILRHQNFLDILKVIVDKLGVSQFFGKQVTKIISNLCKAADQNQLRNFTGIANDLITILIQKCLTPQSSLQALNDSMLAIMDLITVAKNNQLCVKQINFVLENFSKLGSLGQQKKVQMQAGFFTIIQTCLIALMDSGISDETFLRKVYTLVIDHFNKISDVNEDGIYVLGALISFLPNPDIINEIWPYIQHALKKYRQGILFKATLSCITALVHKYRQNMASKLSFVDQLIALLKDNQFDRNLKLQILTCLGDVVLACGRVVIPYLDNIMNVIIMFLDGATQMTKVDFNFSQLIKDCVIDTLFCVFHGLNEEDHQCQQLSKYFETVFKFIQISVQKQNRPKVDFIKKCMVLVADIRNFYKRGVDQYTRQQYVFESLQILTKYNKNDRFTADIDYIKRVINIKPTCLS